MSPTSAPTLLVFTLGAARESARHALLPGGLKSLELGVRQGCLEAALAAGRSCRCRLEVCSPTALRLPADVHNVPQAGSDFGSRLERAMLDAFARGAGPLAIVGSDVPDLAARHLGRALALLGDDPDRVVLGPSPDGGFYLLAVNRPIAGLATATRWCRRATLQHLLRALRNAGRQVVLLEPLADLDRHGDLEAWLAAKPGRIGRWRWLSHALDRILAERRRPLIPRRQGHPQSVRTAVTAGRSPPLVSPL